MHKSENLKTELFNKKGHIILNEKKEDLFKRLYSKIDLDYFDQKQHQFPNNNIEIAPRNSELFGKIEDDSFMISGKKRIFKSKITSVWINGKVVSHNGKSKVEFDIKPKRSQFYTALLVFVISGGLLLALFTSNRSINDNLEPALGIFFSGALIILLLIRETREQISNAAAIVKEVFTTP